MKRQRSLIEKCMLILLIFSLLALPLSANAGQCERYFEELAGQCFETVIDDTEFVICFSSSVYGPCPGGPATLYYTDVQIINDIEYVAEIEMVLSYTTTPDIVTVEGLDFILTGGQLILLPDDPLIFSVVEN